MAKVDPSTASPPPKPGRLPVYPAGGVIQFLMHALAGGPMYFSCHGVIVRRSWLDPGCDGPSQRRQDAHSVKQRDISRRPASTGCPLVSVVNAFDTDISPALSPLSPIFSRISPRVRPSPSRITWSSSSRLLPAELEALTRWRRPGWRSSRSRKLVDRQLRQGPPSAVRA